MPRNVRNFWISVECDARQRPVETGPLQPDGEFIATIKIRNDGAVDDAGALVGECTADGRLLVYWVASNGEKTLLKETVR